MSEHLSTQELESYLWSKAKRQIHSSFVRLAALAGVMGIEIERSICYTAFRVDRLGPKLNPDPILLKSLVGDNEHVVGDHLLWLEDKLDFAGFRDAFAHHKIKLDGDTGVGACLLGLAAASP